MHFVQWWQERQKPVRNVLVVLSLDIVFLLGAILSIPGLHQVWEVLTSFMPNLYEPVFLQLIALVRGMNPGALVASGVFVTYSTLFLTLASVHAIVSATIGVLFSKTADTVFWSVVNYTVLLFILFFFHLFLLARQYFLF